MNTLDLSDAAALLHMSEDALMRKARAGIIPGCKPGRQWVFLEVDLKVPKVVIDVAHTAP